MTEEEKKLQVKASKEKYNEAKFNKDGPPTTRSRFNSQTKSNRSTSKTPTTPRVRKELNPMPIINQFRKCTSRM